MKKITSQLLRDNLLISLLILGAAIWVSWRAIDNFDYQWEWLQPLRFILHSNADGSWRNGLLLDGFLMTIRLTLWGSLLCLLFGLAIAILRVSQVVALRMIGTLFVELVRNTPPLVFMFIIYFFVSSQLISPEFIESAIQITTTYPALQILFGRPEVFENFIAGLLCLALYEAAYVAEIVRGGIQSIEKGQWEGGFALGLRRWQILKRIILPQALRKVVPPTTNQIISLVKDSSIISVISVQELTFAGIEVATTTGRLFETLLIIALLYFTLCFPVSLLLRRFETSTAA